MEDHDPGAKQRAIAELRSGSLLSRDAANCILSAIKKLKAPDPSNEAEIFGPYDLSVFQWLSEPPTDELATPGTHQIISLHLDPHGKPGTRVLRIHRRGGLSIEQTRSPGIGELTWMRRVWKFQSASSWAPSLELISRWAM